MSIADNNLTYRKPTHFRIVIVQHWVLDIKIIGMFYVFMWKLSFYLIMVLMTHIWLPAGSL
jgi:hypothetical protein